MLYIFLLSKASLCHLAEENNLKQEVNEQEGELLRQRNEINQLMKKTKEALKKISELFGVVKEDLLSGRLTPHDIKKKYEYFDALNRGLENKDYPDKEEQQKLIREIDKVAKWQHQQDKKRKDEIKNDYGNLENQGK